MVTREAGGTADRLADGATGHDGVDVARSGDLAPKPARVVVSLDGRDGLRVDRRGPGGTHGGGDVGLALVAGGSGSREASVVEWWQGVN